MAVFFFTAQVAWAGNIKTEKVTLVGNGIVEFIPVGYDVSRTPSLILSHEPEKKGEVPENWKLVPQFTMTDGKANASLDVPAGTRDRKSTRLNSSHRCTSRMPSSA